MRDDSRWSMPYENEQPNSYMYSTFIIFKTYVRRYSSPSPSRQNGPMNPPYFVFATVTGFWHVSLYLLASFALQPPQISHPQHP